ncbi:hypothetical protein [Microbacterium sp. SORGH_AS_0862]|uniref:hypothetical protein n=1 Tax=Microbacterium sp. SORGH_AS_0862 TaxID=3041789 RepID=UPI00278D737D|nr:hypothetical protein [Microbacterium sp. SORGH_AS_0862]MDQ1205069.1 hypothetical protein [Microbacterium sp. SORGH_AS_0862]
MTDTNDEAKGLGVAEARAAVQTSGQLEGIEGPLFLAENETEWLPYFVARYTPDAHPVAAKVIVTRAGQKPREIVISWDEYAEIIEPDPEQAERERDWNATRARKPMSVFGAEVERHAYRVVFADIIEPLIAAKRAAPAPVSARLEVNVAQYVPESRDWIADVDNAQTPQALDILHDEARAAGVLKLNAPLMSAFSKRIGELTAKAPAAAPATPADIVLPSAPSPLAVARASKPLTASAPPQRDRKRRRPPKPQAA